MMSAALVEMARQRSAPPAGNFFDPSAVANISPCQNIDDFNPFLYQQWQAGLSDTQPNYCSQTCNTTYFSQTDDMNLLNLTCINCENIPQTSHLSVLWQIPQFSLIGISEILASITSIEFFYGQAPLPLRSICQALNTGTQALGAISLVPLIYAVNSIPNEMWLPSNLDTGFLDYYFFLLSAVMILDLLFLLWISRRFEYKTEDQLSCQLGEISSNSNHDNSECNTACITPKSYQQDTDTHDQHFEEEEEQNSDGNDMTNPLLLQRNKD